MIITLTYMRVYYNTGRTNKCNVYKLFDGFL